MTPINFLKVPVLAFVAGLLISYGQSREGSKYQRWPDEDVAYIITPYEKQAFSELKTDEEREKYIEAFWRRRDPDQDTEENEHREEYEERVATANKRFRFGRLDGWRSERGRIYITHGEPQEIRKVPSGEIWHYRYVFGEGADVEFEFIDLSGTGDLRLLGRP